MNSDQKQELNNKTEILYQNGIPQKMEEQNQQTDNNEGINQYALHYKNVRHWRSNIPTSNQ